MFCSLQVDGPITGERDGGGGVGGGGDAYKRAVYSRSYQMERGISKLKVASRSCIPSLPPLYEFQNRDKKLLAKCFRGPKFYSY